MSVYTFGISNAGELTGYLPFDPSEIGATSTPVNTGHVMDAFRGGAARAVSLGQSLEIEVSATLLADHPAAHDIFFRYAVAYMRADLLERTQRYQTAATAARAIEGDLQNQILGLPQTMGDAYQGQASITVDLDSVGSDDDPGELGGWNWEDRDVF